MIGTQENEIKRRNVNFGGLF